MCNTPPPQNPPKTKPKTQKTKQNKQINSLNQHEMQINQQKNPSLKPVGLGGGRHCCFKLKPWSRKGECHLLKYH